MIEKNAGRASPAVLPGAGRGFSLLELMVVVALVGILASLAVPSFQGGMERKKAALEIERVSHALLEIRNYARTRIRCVEVTISAHQIVATPYEDGANPNEPCANPTTPIADEVKTYTFASTVSLSAATAPGLGGNLWFDQSGGPFDPSNDTILLDPTQIVVTPTVVAARTVRIYPLTGAVRMLP